MTAASRGPSSPNTALRDTEDIDADRSDEVLHDHLPLARLASRTVGIAGPCYGRLSFTAGMAPSARRPSARAAISHPVSVPERLTRTTLGGVWVAIATPWDERCEFDEPTFRTNVRRPAAAGVSGIYTTDADGEFYAVEWDEFRRIVDALADEAQRAGVATQVGTTWYSTRGVVARLRYAEHQGILGAHIGHPPFMEMTAESLDAYWGGCRCVGGADIWACPLQLAPPTESHGRCGVRAALEPDTKLGRY